MCRGRFAGVPWCAASIFKVLLVDTSFLPKLRKCCHELTVDLCSKSRVAFQVSSIKMMTFFEISTISGSISRLLEIVARRDNDLQKERSALFSLSSVMPLDIN